MERQFPMDMQSKINEPTTIKAWVSENVSPRETDCPNCGGAGYLYVFVATKGPFNAPGGGHGVISKWYDDKWWVGGTYAFQCPACAQTQAPRGTQ